MMGPAGGVLGPCGSSISQCEHITGTLGLTTGLSGRLQIMTRGQGLGPLEPLGWLLPQLLLTSTQDLEPIANFS